MKSMKRLLTLTLAGALLLGGCAGPEPEGVDTPQPKATSAPAEEKETLDFVLPCYPAAGFHPITGVNRLNLTIAPLLYRGLFALNGRFEAEEDLCKNYLVSEDGLDWSFQLAEASFSDGTPLTAREVVESLNEARRSARYSTRLADITRVTEDGEWVRITLSRPNGALPALLDIPVIKKGEYPLRPLGTGPYFLEEKESGLQLTAREGTQMPLETIPLRTVGAGDDLVYAFDAKEISLVDADLIGTNVLGYSGRLETTDYPTTSMLYVGCNMKDGACRDQRVRQAVGRSFNREDIVNRLLAGHAVVAELPIHPEAQGYDWALAEQWSFDQAAAEEMLIQAGWSRNEEGRFQRGRTELSLRLVVNQENTYKVTVAEALASSLRELGCAVTLDKLPWDEFVSTLERGQFDLYLGETVLAADFGLETLLGVGGGLNYGGFVDGQTQEQMEKRRAAQGEERERETKELCARVAEMAPIVPLCFKNGSLLTQWGQVAGAEPTQRDVFAGIQNWRIRQF